RQPQHFTRQPLLCVLVDLLNRLGRDRHVVGPSHDRSLQQRLSVVRRQRVALRFIARLFRLRRIELLEGLLQLCDLARAPDLLQPFQMLPLSLARGFLEMSPREFPDRNGVVWIVRNWQGFLDRVRKDGHTASLSEGYGAGGAPCGPARYLLDVMR